MRLHWVELENWRQHIRTRIDFDDNATVIYGPNETGKSTVQEALSRGLFDKSSSQAEAIKSVKPLTASGNVTSTVRIEFTLNKVKYRVEKNFNLRRGTSLHKVVGEETVLQAQDTSADEQLIQLLEADLPSPRGSKPSQWGAFRWLWAPQDNRELPTDKEGDPTAALHLETKDTGGLLVTPKFQAVQNLVHTSYARYFTKTGKTTMNSPVSNIKEEIQTLHQRSIELRNDIKKVEDEKQQLEDLQRQLPVLEKKLTQTKQELEKARSEATDFSAIESKLNASEAAVKDAKRDLQDAIKALRELRRSADKIVSLQKKEKKAREDLSLLEALCQQLEKRLKEINEKVEKKAMKIRECEELARDARILWTKSNTMNKIDLLKGKITKINAISKKIESLRKDEVSLVPTNKEIEKLIQSQTRIDALNESLTAKGLAVTVTPGEKGSLEVHVDGEKLKHGRLSAIGTESVSVGTLGLGEVVVKANLQRARDAKVDIKRMKRGIQSALSKYAVNSIDGLKKLSRTQKKISNSIKELTAEKRGIDERPISEVTLELKKLKKEYEKYKKIKRTLRAIKVNPADADLGELIKKREKEEKDTRDDLDKARNESGLPPKNCTSIN